MMSTIKKYFMDYKKVLFLCATIQSVETEPILHPVNLGEQRPIIIQQQQQQQPPVPPQQVQKNH